MKLTRSLIIFCLGLLVWIFWLYIAQWIKNYVIAYENVWFNVDSFVESIQQSFASDSSQHSSLYKEFEDVYDVLEHSYYDASALHSGNMREQALKSFVNALDDPYTVYLDAVENDELHDSLQWSENFEGIGAVVAKKDDGVLVQEIIKGSPAFLAWVKPLDLIVQVDDTSVSDMDLRDAVQLIRGPKWSTVVLTVIRTDKQEKKEVLELPVVRDAISFPSVTSEILTGSSWKMIAHITLHSIGEETENLLRDEIRELKKSNIQWVIVDLRWNGGGLLTTAVSVTSHFVPQWQLVVEAKYRMLENQSFYSKWYMDFGDVPVIVLIDGLTASAGEIIALALKEINWSLLLWTTSFGKWSIQTIKEFGNKASLKYTVGKRYSPSGTNIDQVGVEPDVVVEFDTNLYANEGIDNQLQKAIEMID